MGETSFEKYQKKKSFGYPGAFAWARLYAEGDIVVAALLFRLKYRWETVTKKLSRFDMDWIAMSRDDWAREAGLSDGEMKNRALPRLKNLGCVTVRAMKLNPSGPKLLWMNLDTSMLPTGQNCPWEQYYWKINGGNVIGSEGTKLYPYKKGYFDE